MASTDRATQQVAYDKDKFGRWTARLYQVTNKGHKTQRGTPIFTDSNTGEFTLSTPVTADMGPRARFVVEITMLRKDGTENPDAVIYSSLMNVAIRDAAPIDIEVSARRETGPAPFTAAVVVRPVDRSRHADIGGDPLGILHRRNKLPGNTGSASTGARDFPEDRESRKALV